MVRIYLYFITILTGILLMIGGGIAYLNTFAYDYDYPSRSLANLVNTVIGFGDEAGQSIFKRLTGIGVNQPEYESNNYLGVFAVTPYGLGDGSIRDELCPKLFRCKILSLGIAGEIMNYPELFRQITSILERPCDYIKEPIEVTSYSQEEPNIWLMNFKIRESKRVLQCGRPSRQVKFVLLSINNIDLIIKRKDV